MSQLWRIRSGHSVRRSLVVSLLLIASGSARATLQTTTVGNDPLYDAVIERVFEHRTKLTLETLLELHLQLRYTYCSVGEMQVIADKLHEDDPSDFRVTVWYVPTGTDPIRTQLTRIVQARPTVDAAVAATRIRMKQETFIVRAKSPLANLLTTSRTLVATVPTDPVTAPRGMQYEFSVDAGSRGLRLAWWAPEQLDNDASPLVRWMGQVRASVEAELRR